MKSSDTPIREPLHPDDVESRLVANVTRALSGLVLPISPTVRRAPRDGGTMVPLALGTPMAAPSIPPSRTDGAAYATFGGDGLVILDAPPTEASSPEGPVERDVGRLIGMAVFSAVKDSLREVDASHFGNVLRIAGLVDRSLPETRRRASETTIERLVDALIGSHDPIAKVSAEIDAENASARLRYMTAFPTATAEDVASMAGSAAVNRHQVASRWKGEGRIFSVPWRRLERFPIFQFDEGRPIPAVATILAALPKRMSAWEVAFWFVSTNGWLDGKAPCDVLGDPGPVVEAAEREAAAVVG